MYFWRASVQNAVWSSVQAIDSYRDGRGVKVLHNVALAAIREDATAEEWCHCLMVFGGESVAELTRTGRLLDDGMRRMSWVMR